MIQIKKTILTLVALLAVTTGAWAQGYNVTFGGFAESEMNTTVNVASLPQTFTQIGNDAFYPWTVISTSGNMFYGATVTSGGEGKVSVSVPNYEEMSITVSGPFEGTATIHVTGEDDENRDISCDITVSCEAVGGAASAVTVAWDKASKTGTFTMPDYDVEVLVEYYDELMDGDEDDNSALLASLNGKTTDIYVDRTLAKEKWYTLCLPFNVDLTAEGPLKGVTAKTLSKVENDGTTVTVTFGEAVTSLAAGTPYIVRLPDGATENLIDPLFEGATISNELHDVVVTGGTFKGTYARVDWNAPNTRVLFLQDNKFLYPDPSAHVNALRAYIELEKDVPVSAAARVIVDFGEDASGIETVDVDAQQDGIWYTLQGIQLDGKPTEKGIYILNGKKVVVK